MSRRPTGTGAMHTGNTQMILGKLLAKVESIEASIAKMEADHEKSVGATSESRAVIHRRMDEIVSQVGTVKSEVVAVKADVATVTSNVTEMKKITDDVTRWKLMGMGALAVTGFSAAAISYIITAYWAKLVRALVG